MGAVSVVFFDQLGKAGRGAGRLGAEIEIELAVGRMGESAEYGGECQRA